MPLPCFPSAHVDHRCRFDLFGTKCCSQNADLMSICFHCETPEICSRLSSVM